jgi:hypothetical protein
MALTAVCVAAMRVCRNNTSTGWPSMSKNSTPLLHNLLQAAFKLRGAISIFDKPELTQQLTAVIRRLFIADLLASNWTIAVAGTQGAGKTTLMRLLYEHLDTGPDGWLPATPGRDEQLPVLLLEDDNVTNPQGFIRRLVKAGDDFKEEPVTPAEFQRAARGGLVDCLLPVLRLPRLHLAQGDSLLLLPGYESQRAENAEWQALMRQALVGASACVLVTDSGRLANAAEEDILHDLQRAELAGARPIVAVTKTEGMTEDKKQQLRNKAAGLFKTDPAQVLCTGTQGEAAAASRAALAEALGAAGYGGRGATGASQLTHMEALLAELSAVLAEINEALVLDHEEKAARPGEKILLEFLEAYDDGQVRLRSKYEKALTTALNRQLQEAIAEITPVLIREHEGIWNKIKAMPQSASELRQKMGHDIEAAWRKPGLIVELHANVLGTVTTEALGGPKLAEISEPLPARLGYSGADGKPLQWSKVTQNTQQDLANLLGRNMPAETEFSKDLTRSVRLVPAFGLEFCRLAQFAPELVGVDHNSQQKVSNPMDGVRQAGANFQQMSGIHNDIIKTIGVLVAADGGALEIKSLAGLVKIIWPVAAEGGAATAGATAAATVASAAGALIAVAMVYAGVQMAIRAQDNSTYDGAVNALTSIRDAHFSHYIQHFDEVMKDLRDMLQERLRARYHLEEGLMRHDRVARALAQAKSLKDDIAAALPTAAILYGT